MLAKALSGAVAGIEAVIVEVQCDVADGLPKFKIVGLPEKEVKESRDRIRSAIENSNFPFPTKRITANLAPADLKKTGVGLDLPIACSILQATNSLQADRLETTLLIGELSLDGQLRPVSGVLPVALAAKERSQIQSLLVPSGNADEAAIVDGLEVYPVDNLREAVALLSDSQPSQPYQFDRESYFQARSEFDLGMEDVKGQFQAKRGLEVAAAGGHNVLMSGPPGAGKSMLAKRLNTVLPPLTFGEALEVTKIYSIIGKLTTREPLITRRQVRSPHHTISYAGMVGGGHGKPRPGEISLAHNGVLFLDELPEFNRKVLETLRQPLENGSITISRATMSVAFPAQFTLIAAMNPCPCGFLGDSTRKCTCRPYEIERYRKKISGPFLDRIDIFVNVQRLSTEEMTDHSSNSPTSKNIRDNVLSAREIQQKRFDRENVYNGYMDVGQIEKYCQLDDNEQQLIKQAINHFGLSARSYHKVLKIARTIADLDRSEKIKVNHISESIQLRGTRDKIINPQEV